MDALDIAVRVVGGCVAYMSAGVLMLRVNARLFNSVNRTLGLSDGRDSMDPGFTTLLWWGIPVVSAVVYTALGMGRIAVWLSRWADPHGRAD